MGNKKNEAMVPQIPTHPMFEILPATPYCCDIISSQWHASPPPTDWRLTHLVVASSFCRFHYRCHWKNRPFDTSYKFADISVPCFHIGYYYVSTRKIYKSDGVLFYFKDIFLSVRKPKCNRFQYHKIPILLNSRLVFSSFSGFHSVKSCSHSLLYAFSLFVVRLWTEWSWCRVEVSDNRGLIERLFLSFVVIAKYSQATKRNKRKVCV